MQKISMDHWLAQILKVLFKNFHEINCTVKTRFPSIMMACTAWLSNPEASIFWKTSILSPWIISKKPEAVSSW